MFKVSFKPPFSPEFTLVVSMEANFAPHNEISRLMKNCSRASITFGADSEDHKTLLTGINALILNC